MARNLSGPFLKDAPTGILQLGEFALLSLQLIYGRLVFIDACRNLADVPLLHYVSTQVSIQRAHCQYSGQHQSPGLRPLIYYGHVAATAGS